VRELSYRKRGVTLDNRYEITVVFSAPPGGWMNYTPFGDDSNFWLASKYPHSRWEKIIHPFGSPRYMGDIPSLDAYTATKYIQVSTQPLSPSIFNSLSKKQRTLAVRWASLLLAYQPLECSVLPPWLRMSWEMGPLQLWLCSRFTKWNCAPRYHFK
jgi:hypothetical protein